MREIYVIMVLVGIKGEKWQGMKRIKKITCGCIALVLAGMLGYYNAIR